MDWGVAFRPRRAVTHCAAVAGAVAIALVTLGGNQAHASAGCDAVNAGQFNATRTGFTTGIGGITSPIIPNFAVGDTITFTLSATQVPVPPTGASLSWSLLSGNFTTVDNVNFFNGTVVRSYAVTGNNQDTTLSYNGSGVALGTPGTWTITATCTPASATSDSNKLRALQIGISKLVAETSGAAITGAADNAINTAFNGGNPVSVGPNGIVFNFTAEPRSQVASRTDEAFAALGYAMPAKAPSVAPAAGRLWSLWAEIRSTGWDRNTTDLRGHQLNVTAGVGYRATPNLVVGVLAGFEHFKYDVASLTGTMKGDGGTIGGYAGWKIATHLRWDAVLAWSRVAYDATAGTATGSFNGSRLLASTGLTGSYRWAALILEPSARVYALWEHENAYTDSLGTLQTARSFSVGRVSAGSRLIYPWISGDWKFAPYVGLYGDYRFSTDDAVPVGQPVVWIGDGLSARVTGGLTIAKTGGVTVALGSDLGGLGAAYKVWTVNGRVFWPF